MTSAWTGNDVKGGGVGTADEAALDVVGQSERWDGYYVSQQSRKNQV
jgi:hypothetical protein